ncbi:MAG: NADPH:quinone oxidoreductase family protein [Jiangellaceae bacterium]
MKAWLVPDNGEPGEVMRLADVDEPTPQAGQVLVRVKAAALNFPDVLLCRGEYQFRPPLPFTPGVELCGEIVTTGDGVDDLAIGDRVIGTPALPAGALAEYALMNAADAFPAPAVLDDAAAAALHIAYQTGWFGLHRRAQLQAGETLLVHAAAGGVGSAAIQLGKAAGARVIAVVGGPAKAAVAAGLGADVVVDRHHDDVVAAVREATGGRGADVVFDPVGGDAFTQSTRCVAFEGRILVVGFAGGTIPAPQLGHALVKNYSIVGLHWGLYKSRDPASVAAAHEELVTLAGKGVVAPLVSERLALADAVGGLTRLAAGDTVGRVVVEHGTRREA